MYATIEPRLIALLNDTSSDSLNSYPRLDLPPLQDPNILKASGRPLVLEPATSQNSKQSASVSQPNASPYDGDPSSGHTESRAEPGSKAPGNSLRVTSSQSLRKILSDDSEIAQTSPSRKRQRLENRKDDFVQLPQPPKKQKAAKQVVPPIIIGLHELPPNQAALFPPIASSSFHDSHGRNTLNTSQVNDVEEEVRTKIQPEKPKNPASARDAKSMGSARVGIKARKKWTDEETKQLLLGVQKHGIGQWSKIVEDFTFNGRTAVHIKDRFRTCFPDGFQGQPTSAVESSDDVPHKHSDSSKSRSNPISIAANECSTSISSDEPIIDDHLKDSQVKPTKKSRAHRKKFEDLVQLGIVEPFSKSKRRERRPFLEDEDKNILLGYETYGQSSWTLIQRDPRFGLGNRKPTDIRDRFRNRFRDKYFCEDESKKPKKSASASLPYELQSINESSSLQTRESFPPQERMFGPIQGSPDTGTFKQPSQPTPSFTFKGSFTELLGPLPVTDTPDAFSFPQSFDWPDSSTTFSNTIGEMDISRLLLDENWPADPNAHLKQKQSVTDISSICSAIPPPIPQLVSNYNVLGMGYEFSHAANLPLPTMRDKDWVRS